MASDEKLKTIDERVEDASKFLGDLYDWPAIEAEFRRHLIAHEKQVRQEERQGIALAMEDAYKRGWQHAGFAKTLPREEVRDGGE